jgi:signal transduction histidine kinase
MARVVHDLRSPLATMMNYAELLSEPVMQQNEEYLNKCSEVILRQGKQICTFIEDVLSAVKAETNLHQMKVSSFHLNQLVEDVIQEFRQQTSREIFFENQAGDVVVVGDALGLREVLINLVDNGVKFSSPGQPVHVGLLTGNAPGWVEIPVRDHGFGIEQAELDRLFHRFGRIKNEFTDGIPGSGLGLYIVKNIVQHHHGSIAVESYPGEGSTFTVSLPIQKALS